MANPYFVFNKVVTRGDMSEIVLTFQDAAGAAVDISTWDFWYTAKVNQDDSDDDAIIKIDPGSVAKTDSGTGTTDTATFTLTTTHTDRDPGTWYQDIQIDKATGEIYTIGKGILTVEYQVTERVV